MDAEAIIRSWDLTVALDYGQFCLWFGPRTGDIDEVAAVGRAIEDDGIVQERDLVVVLSPHQNNFEMPFRIEISRREPYDDLHQWQEAFEVAVVVTDFGMYYESPTLQGEQIPIPAGAYRMRIAGRGFVARGWPGSTTPGDRWRVQLWPSPNRVPARRLRSWDG